MRPVVLPFTALAVALGLAACHQAATPADNTDDAALIANGSADNAVAATDETTAGTSDEAAPPAIAAPTVAADAPAQETTPLVEAAQTAATIASDTAVTRVAWNDGWAWKRDGQIIRTASRDGGRVSYFHPGDDHPYLVQDGGRSYGYADNGKLAQVYDHGGHPQKPSTADQHDASQFDSQARQDHDHARKAPPAKPAASHEAPGIPGSRPQGKPDDQGDRTDHGRSPHPTPTPSATPSHGAHDRNDRGDNNGPARDDRNGPGH